MNKQVILCVDDEKFALDSLKAQLKYLFGSKYLYEIAENAEEAMEVIDELNNQGYDILVIVSDWLMPGIKGDELLIRIHKKFPKIVKVILTGHASEEAIDRARREANLYRCLRKPWTEEELADTIITGLEQL
jgi:CheY-like chemotaxis protein